MLQSPLLHDRFQRPGEPAGRPSCQRRPDRFEVAGDQRQHILLPKDIECYSIAADNGKESDSSIRLLGDKLVSIKSALGQHKMADKNFYFGKENTWISYESTHMDLLSDPKIYDKIKE